MPQLHPFSAWHYNPDKISNLDAVISPPYDVISKEDQAALYDKSEYNFCRIILPKERGSNRYKAAVRTLWKWIDNSILVQDSHPALYLMEQSFLMDDKPVIRTGIIGELALEELGENILPHEQTIEKHIDDRYRLMEATQTNSGQIFMCYRDPNCVLENLADQIKRNKPVITCKTDDDVKMAIWPVADRMIIRQIQHVIQQSKAIIADGHHRYKTALKYMHSNRSLPGSDRVMVTLVNAYNPGMQVLPTHRIIHDSVAPEDLLKQISSHFRIRNNVSLDEMLSVIKKDEIVFGLYNKHAETAWILEYSGDTSSLDIEVFHEMVLKQGFGMDTSTADGLSKLSYLRGTSSPAEFIASEDFKWLGLIKPPNLNEIFSWAEDGRVMPQKSTYFYPKIYSGLLLRSF